MEDKIIMKMEKGKIYFISYGQTTLVARYKSSNEYKHFYYDCLHNWAGHENFYEDGYFINSGIEYLRRASDPEKQALLRYSIEKGTI